MYLAIKHIHLTCIVLSLLLFVLRGYWALLSPDHLQRKWVKVVPHVIDTILLLSALTLAALLKQYPFVDHWLTAKVIALLAYIGFGSYAIKRGRSRSSKTVSFIFALLCFGYIVAVAINHSPTPWG